MTKKYAITAVIIASILLMIILQIVVTRVFLSQRQKAAVNAQENYYLINVTVETTPQAISTATPTPTQKTKRSQITEVNDNVKSAFAATAPAGSAASNIEGEVIQLINQKRAVEGLSTLVTNTRLIQAARRQSQDNASRGGIGDCSHSGSDGSDFVRRAADSGYANVFGETVGCGYSLAQQVVDSWWNSPSHKAILTNPQIKSIGVGWVQNKQTAQTILVGF